MTFLRTRLRFFAALGLIALALQFAVSLGHHHDGDAGMAHSAAADAALEPASALRTHLVASHAHADDAYHGSHYVGDHHDTTPGHDEGGACDICWLRSHAQQATLLAQPLPAVQPVTYKRISYGTKPQARPVICWRTPVQARAPPLAAPV